MRTSHVLSVLGLGLALFGFGCAASTPAEENTPNATSTTAVTATSTPSAATTTAPTTTAPKPTTTTKPKTTTTTPPPATHTSTVTISNMAFGPQVLAVAAGDTVVWVNKDTVPHTTKAENGLLWDSGTIRPGGSYSRVFKAPGSYTYSCGIHPTMHGTIIVR